MTAAEYFWAVITAIALLAVIAMLWLGVWALVKSICGTVERANNATGIDVLGDGGRRLD
jgi:ABC-type Na+ efflux pump permease subunit